ncbi:MAG: YihY/virulence factor BrkB family protein [Gemmatimonadetes bacterium]|nr:YihY/virulence factor BrkB family protein [Gemmatimonadota bacterium]
MSSKQPSENQAAAGSEASGPAAVVFVPTLWRKLQQDDVLFMASGVAFNILLAGVPFFLLLASGIGYVLGQSEAASNGAAAAFIRDLFPLAGTGDGSVLDPVIRDIVRTRGTAGLLGAVAFIWFSTRLFGSLRTVFNRVFDVQRGKGMVIGKLLDVWLTVAAAALVIAWIAASAYIALARTRGVAALADLGLHSDAVMQPLTYLTGRLVAFMLLTAIFFALYKVLPNRKVRNRQALLGGLVSAAMFEVARAAFTWIILRWNPATLYTGTLAAIVIVVFWVYYGALIVIVGGEASQVRERARNAKLSA